MDWGTPLNELQFYKWAGRTYGNLPRPVNVMMITIWHLMAVVSTSRRRCSPPFKLKTIHLVPFVVRGLRNYDRMQSCLVIQLHDFHLTLRSESDCPTITPDAARTRHWSSKRRKSYLPWLPKVFGSVTCNRLPGRFASYCLRTSDEELVALARGSLLDDL